MQAFLAAPDCAGFLAQELGVTQEPQGDWLVADELPRRPWLAFARQVLPAAQSVQDLSINGWAERIANAAIESVPDAQPWRLHLWPAYGEGRAGTHRCELIRNSLTERLKKKRRSLLRSLEEGTSPFKAETSLVQAALTAPDAGFISVAAAPLPQRCPSLISSFPAGEIAIAEDKLPPSRAFAKLMEAELRLGAQIERGQTCVDLGASPGSWSYVALQRGAQVTAVDRSELRDDLMRHPRLRFQQADAFKFAPESPVDWLICDVIAAPQRSIDLLLEWLREKRMRRFVVTLKFKGTDEYHVLGPLKESAPALCTDFRLNRLCANKNEVCAFGTV